MSDVSDGLEEIVRRFETRTAVAALAASESAISVSRLVLGSVPDFVVDPPVYARPPTTVLFLVESSVTSVVPTPQEKPTMIEQLPPSWRCCHGLGPPRRRSFHRHRREQS
jgi:hypothetical protein